jgi:hypothetical protein
VKGDIENELQEEDAWPYEKGPVTGQWNIVQIQGKGNQEPIPEYKAMIKEWFQSIGPGNIQMEGREESVEDQLSYYNTGDYAEILRGEKNSMNDYGIGDDDTPDKRILREWNQNASAAMKSIYERVLDGLEKDYGRRQQTYSPRVMYEIAEALADIAWKIDMDKIQKVIAGIYPRDWNFDEKPVEPSAPNRPEHSRYSRTSAMTGLSNVMDQHMEEFDKWGPDWGVKLPDREDYETEEEYAKAEEEAFENEAQIRDEAYREWMNGGMDMAINDRWRTLSLRYNNGLYPWEVLANFAAGKQPYEPTERLKREHAQV